MKTTVELAIDASVTIAIVTVALAAFLGVIITAVWVVSKLFG